MKDKELISYLNDFITKIKSKPLPNTYIYYKGKKKRVYANTDDIVIAIDGSFESVMYPPKKIKEILNKKWCPIILNNKELLYPIDNSSDGYDIKYYQLSNYIK